ncbi:methyltransferase domain-containing protein [Candidatus Gottesmanbacteria bacterium]|nr:methyltransferase domain-containing protein [Candidatus Gottesmanbacteria bacterium]
MPQYFFILGRNPSLSIAEILSVLNSLSISFEIKIISQEVLIIETENTIDANQLVKTFGGTIKIGQVIQSVGLDEDESNFQKVFEADNLTKNYFLKLDGKIHFGISIYDGGTDRIYLNKITSKLKILSIAIKENLADAGLRAGFVRLKERFLSSVSVWKNKLLTDGAEIVLILTRDQIFAGKTLAVQEFESFSFRDYGRPERDTRSGIIPPKLARMMINLASISKEELLVDPFCGSGTILQEAIILGYRNILGSDISHNAISDTRKNIDWLFDHFYNIDRSIYNINIYQSDIRSIPERIKSESIDTIVTEPYLGPPLFKSPSLDTINRIFDEVGKLYLDAFSQIHKILKKTGKVVFIFPAFEIKGKMQYIPILDKIKSMGFSQKNYFPIVFKDNPIIMLTSRNTIIYGGKEQFVKREIISWQKG